jgi:hypothetical protein
MCDDTKSFNSAMSGSLDGTLFQGKFEILCSFGDLAYKVHVVAVPLVKCFPGVRVNLAERNPIEAEDCELWIVFIRGRENDCG